MLKNKRHENINVRLLFLNVAYLVVFCFVFFFMANIVIDLIFDGKVNLTREVIIDIMVVSAIAGTTGGLGSWLLAKID